MKTEKTKTPRLVESFGPELLAAILKGATAPFTLEMSYKFGVRFRQRIHQLREAMRVAKHEKYSLVARTRVSIEWPDGCQVIKTGRHVVPVDRNVKCKVTIQPNDTEFGDILIAAGIELGGDMDTLLHHEPSVSHDISVLDDMLKDLK